MQLHFGHKDRRYLAAWSRSTVSSASPTTSSRRSSSSRARPDRSGAGDVRRHVVGALLLQVVAGASARPAHRGAVGARRPGGGRRVVDVGDGLAVALRIESHNHPSAVEPYQGAATGVGGIIRDIFSMGARPIALMDPLRFGPLDDARTRYLLGVVSGISGYGNAVGVPTVGGEVVFDDCYRETRSSTCCAWACSRRRLVLPRPWRGNLAVLLGSSTGATASAAPACWRRPGSRRAPRRSGPPCKWATRSRRRSSSRRASLLDAGLAVGVQDLEPPACRARRRRRRPKPAREWTSTWRVCRREPGMSAVEVMTSESQERMLVIVQPDDLAGAGAVRAVGDRRARGRPRDRQQAVPRLRRAFRRSRRRRRAANADLGHSPTSPSRAWATALYDRPRTRPAAQDALPGRRPGARAAPFPAGADLSRELLALLATPTIADKSWVWRQYDHQLFLNTIAGPGAPPSCA